MDFAGTVKMTLDVTTSPHGGGMSFRMLSDRLVAGVRERVAQEALEAHATAKRDRNLSATRVEGSENNNKGPAQLRSCFVSENFLV